MKEHLTRWQKLKKWARWTLRRIFPQRSVVRSALCIIERNGRENENEASFENYGLRIDRTKGPGYPDLAIYIDDDLMFHAFQSGSKWRVTRFRDTVRHGWTASLHQLADNMRSSP